MRQRIETVVSEARTNADAHLAAMRTEVDEVKTRADDAYRETLASFEKDRGIVEAARTQLQDAHEEILQSWAEGVQEARSLIEGDVDGLKSRLQETVEWAEDIKGDIQIAALASGFQDAQKRYGSRAKWALVLASVLAAAAVAVAVGLFTKMWDIPTSASNAEIAKHVGLRLAVISLPLFAAVFAARIYRTNSHLE